MGRQGLRKTLGRLKLICEKEPQFFLASAGNLPSAFAAAAPPPSCSLLSVQSAVASGTHSLSLHAGHPCPWLSGHLLCTPASKRALQADVSRFELHRAPAGAQLSSQEATVRSGLARWQEEPGGRKAWGASWERGESPPHTVLSLCPPSAAEVGWAV